MERKLKLGWTIFFLFFFGLVFLFPLWPDKKLHLIFCNVGQGDGILVKQGRVQVVIDGGPGEMAMVDCLGKHLPPWDKEIELLVLTHPDNDHLGGLVAVLKRYEVGQIVVNSVIKEADPFWQFYQSVVEEKTQIYSPQAGDQFILGPLELTIIWPVQKLGNPQIWQPQYLASLENNGGERAVLGATEVGEDSNETSIVFKLSYGHFDTLLTGDIGFDTENVLEFPDIEVLKVPHHGSRFSTSEELLEETTPDWAVISVGKNTFGHPTQEVLDRLSQKGIKVARTDQGEVEIISDGQSYWFK
ncbi:ComEC/Rec2 family competence protein [Patescibacteria group bacterium]